jgi:hypothetical protein
MDVYLTQDHAARRRTMFVSLSMGIAVGSIAQLWGLPFNFAVISCVLMIGFVEIVQALRYVEPFTKSSRYEVKQTAKTIWQAYVRRLRRDSRAVPMNGGQQRRFVYGMFRCPVPAVVGRPEVGLEVLREFGTTELIGKVYIRLSPADPWTPVQGDSPTVVGWHQNSERFQQHFVFDMAGSGVWDVVHFRAEADETGPYVTVALRYSPKKYP